MNVPPKANGQSSICRVAVWVAVAVCAADCGRIAQRDTTGFPLDPAWELRATRRMAAHELWKEHNGGDHIYIERGCLAETITDYHHRSRPWMIRCSIFEHKEPNGAHALFDHYHAAVDHQEPKTERIGDATYLCSAPGMHSWVLGFCQGRHFVEVSLTEETNADKPLTELSRRALCEFAQKIAASLPGG